MPIEPIQDIRGQAIDWHIRLRDGSTADWDAFVEWLESDPRHSRAYDEVALDDQDLDLTLVDLPVRELPEANDNQPTPGFGRRWVVGGLGLAAAAAAVLLVVPASLGGNSYYDVATAPGQQRTITLDASTRIALNGDTRLRLDHNNPRFASLASGEASFSVHHDPDRPFMLEVGDQRIQDVGTRFDVIRDATGHRVAVAEGSVVYNPDGEKITLTAGQSLTRDNEHQQIVLKRQQPSEIGGWQHGRLSYTATPLALVLADIGRNLGTAIKVDPAIARREFTGTIEIDRKQGQMLARMSELLGIEIRRAGDGWVAGPRRP